MVLIKAFIHGRHLLERGSMTALAQRKAYPDVMDLE